MDSVAKLDAASDRLERQNRRANLVLRNLPCTATETKNNLKTSIASLCSTAGAAIDDGDIVFAARFKASQHTIHPIIVKFKDAATRDKLMDFNFKNLKCFNLEQLKFGTTLSRIYFNEHLTDRNMKIFNLAMQLKNVAGSKISKVITRNGLVFITESGQSKGMPIVSIDELKVFNPPDTGAQN